MCFIDQIISFFYLLFLFTTVCIIKCVVSKNYFELKIYHFTVNLFLNYISVESSRFPKIMFVTYMEQMYLQRARYLQWIRVLSCLNQALYPWNSQHLITITRCMGMRTYINAKFDLILSYSSEFYLKSDLLHYLSIFVRLENVNNQVPLKNHDYRNKMEKCISSKIHTGREDHTTFEYNSYRLQDCRQVLCEVL